MSYARMQEENQRLREEVERYYNFERRHQGYRLQGRVPAELFYSHQLSTPDVARTC